MICYICNIKYFINKLLQLNFKTKLNLLHKLFYSMEKKLKENLTSYEISK